jgi:hypothetical protein
MIATQRGSCQALRANQAWTLPSRALPALLPCKRSLPRVHAAKKEDEMPGVGLDPTLEIAVPKDQRPVNELKQLKQASLYSWVSDDRRCCNATAAS